MVQPKQATAVATPPTAIDFNGIVLNRKGVCKTTPLSKDGAQRFWYTVLYHGQEIKIGSKVLRAFTGVNNSENLTISAMDENTRNTSEPIEFSNVLASL